MKQASEGRRWSKSASRARLGLGGDSEILIDQTIINWVPKLWLSRTIAISLAVLAGSLRLGRRNRHRLHVLASTTLAD